MKSQPQTTKHSRSGFTLIELIAVIAIIAILMSLLLPAITGAFRNARNAEVSAEFTRLTTSITTFRSDHGGVEPWSYILFDETGTWSDGSDPARDAALKLSRSRLRRIWPQFNFAALDLNGDSSPTDVTLTSGEALVFFLGGMRRTGTTGLIGFSKNPISPFSVTGDNRDGPYFEFSPDQLVDTDGDGMLEYTDSLPDQVLPLHYVSSNNGQGYSKTGVSALSFYVQADGTTPWKKDSFQLISPGDDGEYGLDLSMFTTPVYSEDTELSGSRREEADNLANFNPGGTLN